MSNLGYQSRNYNIEELKKDPIGHLSNLLGLNSELTFIKSKEREILPILSGLIVYRQLGRIEKYEILERAQNLGNPRFFGKIQGLVAHMITNPIWNTWCLSDGELRNLFNTNKAVSDFLGTWFITADGKLEVGFIAGAIYGISVEGGKNYLSGQLGKPIAESALARLKLSKQTAQVGGRVFLVTVILASVVKKFTESEANRAKIELLNRGLLKAGDL